MGKYYKPMGKRIFIMVFVGFGLLFTPALAENPNFCRFSAEIGKSVTAKVAISKKSQIPDHVWVTAYTSSPEETDDTPFITASMSQVRDGVIAANFLPFGTKVMIPEIFGDKIFTVEDRMHRRKKNYVDIWMSSKDDALDFGITKAKIVIVAMPS